jgi:hypothetical protein
MWFSLRTGLANTAAIAALATLPLVSLAAAMLKPQAEPVRIDLATAQAATEDSAFSDLLDGNSIIALSRQAVNGD